MILPGGAESIPYEHLSQKYQSVIQDEKVLSFYQRTIERLLGFVEAPETCPIDAAQIPSMLAYTKAAAYTSDAVEGEEQERLGATTLFATDEFDNIVHSLDIRECLVTSEGKGMTPKTLRHRLIPLSGVHAVSYEPAGYGYSLPEDVTQDFDSTTDGELYMDANLGIGLVHNGVLRAIAGGYIERPDSNITILQLQGLLGSLSGTRHRFKSGLYDGFNWRMSLVNAWQQVGDRLGSKQVSITGAIAHPLSAGNEIPYYLGAYDWTAERLGFAFNSKNGCWVKDLGAPAK